MSSSGPLKVTAANFRINRLSTYRLGEIAEHIIRLRNAGRDIIDLSHFSPDLPPPAVGVDKLVSSVLQPHNHRYSASQGIAKLRRRIAEWYKKRFEIEVDPDREVVVTLGTKEGLSHLLLAVLEPGDRVILPIPAYPIHYSAISIAGGVACAVQLPRDAEVLSEKSEEFFLRLEKEVREQSPRMIILCFPNNPTTSVVTSGFFERLVGFARERGIIVVNDFAYADLVFDEYRAPSMLAAAEAKLCGVEFYSLSKGYSLAGWRIGFCVGNEFLIEVLKKLKSNFDSGAFQPLQIASLTVLDNWQDITRETASVYQSRRDILVEELTRIGWNVSSPLATPFIWSRLPATLVGRDGFEIAHRLLAEGNVALCPGEGFSADCRGYVRFSLGEPEKRIRQAVREIEKLQE